MLAFCFVFLPFKTAIAAGPNGESEDWCEDSVDLSEDFAPIKDQGGT